MLPDFNQNWTFLQIFIEVPNIKFHGNPSGGSRADKCGQTDRKKDGWTDNTRLITVCYD